MEDIELEQPSGSVPKALNYSDVIQQGTPPGDLQIVTNIPNNGGTFSPSQTVNIALNVPVNSFVDFSRAYLKFTVNCTDATDGGFLDRAAGGAAIIDSMKILSPTGGVISDIQHYGPLVALLNDYSNVNHMDSIQNIALGTMKSPLGASPISGGTSTTLQDRVPVAKSSSVTVVHTPVGGLFSTDRYLPLGFVNGQLQIQIGLVANATGLATIDTKTTTWTASGFELHLPVVKTPEDFNTNLRQLMASGVNLNIHMKDWNNNQATVASGTTGQTEILLANRKRSVDSVFAIFRKSADITDSEVESVSCRKSCGITSYQYSVAGVEMPAKEIRGGQTDQGEYLANTEMALKRIGSSLSGSTATRDNYMKANDKTGGSLVCFALDMEAYRGVLSGKNLSSAMPLIFRPVLGSGTANVAAEAAATCDVYSHFDSMLTLSGVTGSLSVSN